MVQRIEEIIDVIGVPILVFNRALTLKYFNKSAVRLLPSIEKNLAAEAVFNSKTISTQILECLKLGNIVDQNIRYKTENNTEISAVINDFTDNEEKIAIVTLRDLTPLKEAKVMRSDFVANVSHEIRSPLTAISGFIETLQGPAGDDIDKRSKFLGVVEKETQRVKNLVADLLSLSQVEAKEKRSISTMVDSNILLQGAFDVMQPFATAANKQLKLNIHNVLPQLSGNQENLHRVLVNLIENAINYSDDEQAISIEAVLTENENDFALPALKISIVDRGEGIDPNEIPRLTERFYRIDKSRSRNKGGTGLGLAIVKHILVRHKGALTIDSIKGEGSSFNVFLPLN
ncbi:MAG: GHKL domain-containing protein [Rhodobacteraceae bacterium]|nr:GHKL domain-containing protein [Paracoccaceae bacterium]